MTDSEWLQFVRSLINEPIAKNWSPEEVAVYKKVGIIVATSAFFSSLAVTHKKLVQKTMTKDEPYIELPENFWKPVRLEFANTRRKLRYMQDNENWRFDATGTPVRWMFEDGKIRQVPIPNTTEANYWNFWYLPRFTTLASLPEELHPLIAIEAVISAKAKDEDVTKDLLLKRANYFNSANTSLAVQQLQEPESMPDFDTDEDDYDEIV